MEKVGGIKFKAISGALWKFLERMGAQLVSMIVAIILARILEPDDYSVTSIVAIFFTFANVFISGGFNSALIQKKDADKEDFTSVLALVLGVAVVLYAVFFACAPIIAEVYDKPILIPVIRVMGSVLPINAVNSILSAYISTHLMFRKSFFATLGGTFASAFVGISMAYTGFGAWALVAQQMTNALISTLVLLLTTKMALATRISFTKIKNLFQYGWRVFVSSIIDVIYVEINPLVIGLKYTGVDLAYYSKGKSFPGLLSTVCNHTLSSVLFPVLSKFQDDREGLLKCTRRFVRMATFVVFPALLGFCAIADTFVQTILTDKWLPVAPYIQIFCIKEIVVSIEAGNRESLKAIGRTDLFLRYEVIKKILFFIIIGVGLITTDSPVVLACFMIGCALVVLFMSVYTNMKYLDYGFKNQLRDFVPNLICALVMCAAVCLLKVDTVPPVLELLIQIVFGAFVYILMCIIIKNENLYYVLKALKDMLISCCKVDKDT